MAQASFENAIRNLINEEMNRVLGNRLAVLDRLSAALGNGAGLNAVRRGPGRPPKALFSGAAKGKRARAESGANDRPCALIGCKNNARSKGYCAAHYQKFRNLAKTDRLPSDWKEYAPANSVADIVLPRGRAAAKALKAARKSKS
jgi:hypothetical protein